MRLTAIDRYTATAAAGFVSLQNYIVVDALPPNVAEAARDTVAVPIALINGSGVVVLETVCTGWETVGVAFHLYIQELAADSIAGPLTVLAAPSAAMMSGMQPATSRGGSLAAGTYAAYVGHMHHVTVSGDCTLQLCSPGSVHGGFVSQLFQAEDGVGSYGLVTRLVLEDQMEVGGPAVLTWSVNAQLAGIAWEVAEPQFSGPGTRLAVELWNRGDGVLIGWFHEFA